MGQGITTYFKELAHLLACTFVTDRQGCRMEINQGGDKAVDMILDTAKRSAKVMVMGNGGSAAIASHIHNDLCKAIGIRSLVFNDTPLMTALANDYGYGCIFERPMEMWAEDKDLVVIISSSGCSENVLRAADCAIRIGCRIITFSGFKPDNPLRSRGDINFHLASEHYGLVEGGHSVIAHFLTDQALARAAEMRQG